MIIVENNVLVVSHVKDITEKRFLVAFGRRHLMKEANLKDISECRPQKVLCLRLSLVSIQP